jgi:hypothetical protein
MGVRQNFTGPHAWDNGKTPCRMLKKARLLTRPTPAATSPACPESAKTASSPRDVLVPCKPAASCHFIRGGRDDPNCAQRSHPPTHWHAETCHLPGRGLLVFPTSPSGEQPDCPSLRASDEHRFIVRVLRAQRMVWLLPSCSSEAARCASMGIVPAIPPPFQHPAKARGGGKGHSRSCRWVR